ncbi:MAG: LCP family protein, partial [Fibrobacteres bacterium]|nr:LCP family protein [Fibrobacterota bacterium]
DVTIRGAKGGRKAEKDGQLFEGDTVITGKSGSMELRLGDESLVDLRGESSMLIAALYKASGDGQLAVQFSLLKGGLWSFIKPQPANIKWKFFTAFLVSEIQGTEIEINHSAEQSVLLVKKGQVYAGRNGTEKRLSVMEGQKIVVPSDIAKDIAVSELTEEDRKGADKEMTSVLASGEAGSSSSVRRFIVMLVPYYYIVSEFNKQTGAVSVTRIIPTANVSEYVEGVNELGKVYLYGGIRLTISVIERMTRKRIERYAVLDRNGVFKTIDRIGGVTVELSAEDAENLGLKSGPNKLDSEKVLKYLQGKDKNSGLSLEKQDKLIRAMYAEISGSKLNATKALISQLTSGLETDIDVSYGTDLYDVIKSRKDWRVDIVSY